jgi:hypothetical protein
MWKAALFLVLLLPGCPSSVDSPKPPRKPEGLAAWLPADLPPESDPKGRNAFFRAANKQTDHRWCVFLKDGVPDAEMRAETPVTRPEEMRFVPTAGRFSGGHAFARVEDGWLVGFNEGEFGAALYWFDPSGERSTKISEHQVEAFFSLADGLYAIEGLAHLSLSEGSIIRVTRSAADTPWRAEPVVRLPAAPHAISLRSDGTMLVALSRSLVSLGKNYELEVLLQDLPWWSLYPTSSVLSADERKLYIGMRQFVAEVDLESRRLRYLVPSPEFLNE